MGYDIYSADSYYLPYERVDRDEDYFSANIGGMGWLAGHMESTGMLCHAPGPTREEWDALPKYDESATDEYADWGGKTYVEASDRLLALHRGECPGIPEHKVYGTNDGWWVIPGEIRPALEAYSAWVVENGPMALRISDAEDLRFWTDWISYLGRMVTRGGFRVR